MYVILHFSALDKSSLNISRSFQRLSPLSGRPFIGGMSATLLGRWFLALKLHNRLGVRYPGALLLISHLSASPSNLHFTPFVYGLSAVTLLSVNLGTPYKGHPISHLCNDYHYNTAPQLHHLARWSYLGSLLSGIHITWARHTRHTHLCIFWESVIVLYTAIVLCTYT